MECRVEEELLGVNALIEMWRPHILIIHNLLFLFPADVYVHTRAHELTRSGLLVSVTLKITGVSPNIVNDSIEEQSRC